MNPAERARLELLLLDALGGKLQNGVRYLAKAPYGPLSGSSTEGVAADWRQLIALGYITYEGNSWHLDLPKQRHFFRLTPWGECQMYNRLLTENAKVIPDLWAVAAEDIILRGKRAIERFLL